MMTPYSKIGRASAHLLLGLIMGLGLVSLAFGQKDIADAPAVQTKPIVTTAARFDVSPSFRTLAARTKGGLRFKKGDDDDFQAGPVGDVHHDPDGALQNFEGKGVFNSNLDAPVLGVSFDGQSNPAACGGCSPPDPNGEVSPTHYVQMVNSQIQIFTRTGTSVFGPVNINTMFAGFGGPCQTENAGDPVVLYDQMADRWLISQFTDSTAPFFNCVAVSTSGDPTGSYYRYAFAAPTFPDYPKYSVWPDAYYLNTRESNGGVLGLYALDRAQMLLGNPLATSIRFTVPETGTGPNGLLPSDVDGNTLPPAGSPNYFVGTRDNDFGAVSDDLIIYKFHADFSVGGTPTLTGPVFIPVASFDSVFPCSGGGTPSRNCIPQPGTTTKIDILSSRQRPTFRLAYRNFGSYESLVTNQSVEAQTGVAGVRWYEIRNLSAATPTLYQQGTYSPDTTNRWMGSAAMDRLGNLAIAYSASDSTVFPSLRATGRLVTDPLNTLPQGELTLHAGTGSQTSTGSRWGDYSSLAVDPTDDCTFWYTTEYYATTTTTSWKTRVTSFKFPQCTAATAANVSVAGRVLNSSGRGIASASVRIQSMASGWNSAIRTSKNGSFVLPEVPSGDTYIVTVNARRYTFNEPSRILNLQDSVAGFDFIAN